MFDPSDKPRVFALPLGVDFSDGLIQGFDTRMPDPIAAAKVRFLVNTKRMARRMRDILQAQGPRLQPKIDLLTNLSNLPGAAVGPPPAKGLEKQLALVPVIQALLDREPHLAPRSAVFELATSLAALYGEMGGEGVTLDDIEKLNVGDHADYWQLSKKLIEIAGPVFHNPDRPDVESAGRARTLALIKHWEHSPPTTPLIVAGSTGSRGTTFDLMVAVAKLPLGAVVLPGFDKDMTRDVWDKLTESDHIHDHPQYRFAKLLQHLNLKPDEVEDWAVVTPHNEARNRLTSLALRPAPVTHDWLRHGPDLTDLDQACDQVTWLEAKDQRQEAEVIALRLRKAVADGQSAAVVTPDRMLTRRIAAALNRWGIRPDDSAGVPLPLTPPGRLMLQMLGLWQDDPTPVSVITALKHPLTANGPTRGTHLRHTRDLELDVRRGRVHMFTPDGLAEWGAKKDDRGPWVDWVSRVFLQPTPLDDASIANWVTALSDHVIQVVAGPLSDGDGLWDMETGRKSLEVVEQLQTTTGTELPVSLRDFATIFRGVLSAQEARDRLEPNSTITIWGTLEARVQGAGLTILAGLNEGIWPELPKHDPWLNRPMRRAAKLLLPERRIGLAAHDFQQAFAGAKVWVTRSLRADEAETVPSRWLNRLDNLLSGLPNGAPHLKAMKTRAKSWVAAANDLDEGTPVARYTRPAPVPPIPSRPRALSVTEIKTLIRDPYAIYAKHVLGLRSLDDLGRPPGPALRGTLYHDALHYFVRDHGPKADKDILLNLIDEELAKNVQSPSVRKFWRFVAEGFASWFVDMERKRPDDIVSHALERQGHVLLPAYDFKLIGKPDRIDITDTGWARVYDYKTGTAPSSKEQSHFDKQLPLLQDMINRRAFKDVAPKGVLQAAYIQLKAPYKEVPSAETDPAFWTAFDELIGNMFTQDFGFAARRAMATTGQASDYDHLSRYGEWDTSKKSDPKVLT